MVGELRIPGRAKRQSVDRRRMGLVGLREEHVEGRRAEGTAIDGDRFQNGLDLVHDPQTLFLPPCYRGGGRLRAWVVPKVGFEPT